MNQNISSLDLSLEKLPKSVTHLYLAFSGGLDSCVLLHALLAFRKNYQITLWHINHGLQDNALEMEQLAVDLARKNNLVLRLDSLDLTEKSGNLEERARHLRYALFSQTLQQTDALLTAHHMNDQAETLLLNLMRGSGPSGLRAISFQNNLGQGFLFRPLLNTTRDQIKQYAQSNKLLWIEDPSNQDINYDRNYLRHDVLPKILSRWPATINQLHRVSELQNEAESLSADLANIDLHSVATNSRFSSCLVLNISEMRQLSSARQRNLIRFWLSQHSVKPVGYKKMHELVRQMKSPSTATLSMEGQGYFIKSYQGYLYLILNQTIKLNQQYTLHKDVTINLPEIKFSETRESVLKYLKREDKCEHVSIRFRQNAPMPVENKHSHTLKRLFQKNKVPPWIRPICPQVLVDDELVGLLIRDAYSEGS